MGRKVTERERLINFTYQATDAQLQDAYDLVGAALRARGKLAGKTRANRSTPKADKPKSAEPAKEGENG